MDPDDDGGDAAGAQAANFAILAKTGITTVPYSVVTGDIGVSPISFTSMTGFALSADSTGTFSTSTQVTGQVYASDYADPTPTTMTTAISDMQTAYIDAAGRSTSSAATLNVGAGSISGVTFAPGVYTWATNVNFVTDIYLEGNSSSVWIFQSAGGLTVGSATNMILVGDGTGSGAPQASNIFWQLALTLTVGTAAHIEGNYLTKTEVSFGQGSSLNGRILTQTAAALDQATVTKPDQCADSTNWYGSEGTSQNCSWVSEDPDARCIERSSKPSVFAFEECSLSCGVCGIPCVDNSAWHKKGTPSKGCSWVSRSSRRYAVVGEDDTLATEGCPSATNHCEHGLVEQVCEDSSTWFKNGESSKGCAWVAELASQRCRVKSEDKIFAFEECEVACGNCNATCVDNSAWYKEGSPENDCDWAARSAHRANKIGQDGTYAWESCRASASTCNEQL